MSVRLIVVSDETIKGSGLLAVCMSFRLGSREVRWVNMDHLERYICKSLPEEGTPITPIGFKPVESGRFLTFAAKFGFPVVMDAFEFALIDAQRKVA